MLLLFGPLILAGCASHHEQVAMNSGYTSAGASSYVRWWAKMLDRPSARHLYEQALAGDHAALREILHDPRSTHGPADQEGYSSFVLAGAFVVILGDRAFSDFVRAQPPDVQRSVFSGLFYGPFEHSEPTFSHAFPRTSKLRYKFYATHPGNA